MSPNRLLLAVLFLVSSVCGSSSSSNAPSYLFLWAGDAEGKASPSTRERCRPSRSVTTRCHTGPQSIPPAGAWW
jgi:hypothetical protein